MSGANADNKSGDPAPGIDRVQVYLYTDDGADDDWNDETLRATWSVTGGTGTGSDSKSWTLTGKSLTGFDGNNYLVVEVRDITGVITTAYQKIFVDNTVPNLSVTKPEATKKVAGDFRVYGTITDDLGSGFDGGTPVKVEVLNGA
nr:hypothetical protein [Spirochaetota bacterium]